MNRIFAILIACSLALPVFAIDEQFSTPVSEENLEIIQPEMTEGIDYPSVKQESLPPQTLPTRYKEPISKKKLVKKFILAMLCVAGASVFLYATLSVYNKIRDGFSSQDLVPPEGEKPLDAPCDLTDAIKTFVEKTRWNS